MLLSTSVATSQGIDARVLAGPGGGFGTGPAFGSAPVYAGSDECGTFSTGVTRGLWFGARYLSPSFFSDRLGLSAMVSWGLYTAAFSADPIDRQLATDPVSGELITLERTYELESTSRLAQLDLLADYRPLDRWHAMIGPWIGYQLSFTSRQADSLAGPGRASFPGGERSRVMNEGVPFTPARIGGGILLAVGAELPIGERALLLPEISFRARLTSPVREAWWGSATAGAGLSILFDLHRAGSARDTLPPQLAPERVSEHPTPRVPRLSASIRIDGLNEQGVREHGAAVEMTTVSYHTSIPLLPMVFFDRNAEAMPERYVLDTSIASAPTAVDALRNRDAIEVHRHTLDIIGSRMRTEPAATLALHGSTSSDESGASLGASPGPALGAARAREVKRYLVDNWGIAPARITVAAGPGAMRRSAEGSEDGRAENRRVEIQSSDPAILAPVIASHMAQEFDPPGIAVLPTMEAEAGVRRWSIEITHGGRRVSYYSSDDKGIEGPEIAWKIADVEMGPATSPIGVALTVEDSAGGVITVRDEMPIALTHRAKVVDRSINFLAGFEYNSPEPGDADREALRQVAAALTPGSHVTVTGYTDRIGGEGYNVELSRRRAERVVSILNDYLARRAATGIDLRAEGGGIETERFTNDLPEGRVLSRGVRVMVVWGR